MPDNPNFPSEFVAAAYFFPVNVLAAVRSLLQWSLAAGAEPLIHRPERDGSRRGCGAGGTASCAASPAQKVLSKECSMK